MGLCQSEEEKKQTKNSKMIDKSIREIAEGEDKQIKLLLLGAGECGKSTLMKQMRSVVYSNTVHAMAELLRGMNLYKIGFTEPKRMKTTGIVEISFLIKGVLFEDETTNRMIESMRLFESICNSRWFLQTSIILFLNKRDIFAEKITFVSIRVCFKDYDGPQTYDDSINFIRRKFEALNANPRKTIYVHQTCATDTDQIQLILDSVISMIIQTNLHKSGLY
uniref:Uncharacterized protein n=1 Tax=Meloidogyne floridensis TaxID=298350 RepID=A0A915NL39_9BILA